MRGSYRGNDTTLRWALVAGLALVVLIATIVAISSALGGSSKPKTAPPSTPPPASNYCLWPANVQVQRLPMAPRVPKLTPAGLAAKHALASSERLIRKHSNIQSVMAVSRSGRHLLFLNKNRKLVLTTPGQKSKVFNVHALDFSFNGNGKRIIFQKAVLRSHPCATLALISMSLTGKHKRVLLASGAFHLANADASGGTAGVLQQDVLPNGWIVLVRDQRLYAFDPITHRIAPLETARLGRLFTTGGTVSVPIPRFSVAPSVAFAAEAKFNNPVVRVYSLPTWVAGAAGTVPASVSQVAWSFDGSRIAYPTATGRSLRILNVKTGNVKTISLPARFPAMTLGNLRWSTDDRFLGFTGVKIGAVGGLPKAFMARTTGKKARVHLIGVKRKR